MGLRRFIRQESEIIGQRIAFMLIFSGIATGLLVSVINHAAEHAAQGIEGRLLLLYLVVFLLYIYTLKYSLAHTIYPLTRALYRLRLRLINRACTCDLSEFERFAHDEFPAKLSHEINLAAQILPWIPYTSQAAVIVLFSMVYLAWLSFAIFLIVALTIITAALWHIFVERQMHLQFRTLSSEELEFSTWLRRLSAEAIELRLNSAHKSHFIDELSTLSQRGETLKNLLDRQTISSIMSTRIALFSLLAVFVFIIPLYDPSAVTLIFKTTVVVFFIMGPISQLVYALPLLLRLDSALAAVYHFEQRLNIDNAGLSKISQFSATPFHTLHLSGARFSYPTQANMPVLNDLNFTLIPGSIIFICGVAGSGKTTLLKLLSGLYIPEAGTLTMEQRQIRAEDYPVYRTLFACALRDMPPPTRIFPATAQMPALLAQVGLQQVEYRDGELLAPPLSSVQQWRLRLATCLAQERAVYLFDDSPDAALEDWFYQQILPTLRAKGKIVVVANPPERWFSSANQVFELHNGQLRNCC
jgi:putative pyoverdin transport system ATP-binding/permease protein